MTFIYRGKGMRKSPAAPPRDRGPEKKRRAGLYELLTLFSRQIRPWKPVFKIFSIAFVLA
jgi:hypothetical protein